MMLERKVQSDAPKPITERLLDILYPPRCPFCGRVLRYYERYSCGKCRASLPYVPRDAQRREINNIDLCLSAFEYRDSVRESLHRYKFSSCRSYGRDYAQFMADEISRWGISCDVITWVPISRKRLRERGYDQSEIIARELGRIFGVKCEKLLDKTVNNRAQSSTGSAEERRRNTAGVYARHKGAEMDGKSVLIIDDIVTTGSTLSECASVLKASGAKRIYAAAAASSRKMQKDLGE